MLVKNIIEYLILVGSAALAIERIFSLVIKPRGWFKKKEEAKAKIKKEQESKEIKKLITETIEEKECLDSDRLKTDFKKIANNLLDEFYEMRDSDIDEKFEIIQESLEEINKENQKQGEALDILAGGTRALLSREIWKIYHKYKRSKRLPQTVKVDLDHMFQDYTKAGGNSTIPSLYKEISKWEVIGYEE